MQKATFGEGCFWGVEATYRRLRGVQTTAVGYAGGPLENPTYEAVCTGNSGHAEVVQLEYDPKEVSYGELLEVFWSSHDPTTLNRQGPDRGTQYRSVIFCHSAEQLAQATESKQKWDREGRFKAAIVTEILEAPVFYKAEDYHQQYLEKRGLFNCH